MSSHTMKILAARNSHDEYTLSNEHALSAENKTDCSCCHPLATLEKYTGISGPLCRVLSTNFKISYY